MKIDVLDARTIDGQLSSLPGWERIGDAILKQFVFGDFGEAVRFVTSLLPIADGMDHHPDVQIHWNTVELMLWTHSAGGITDRDLKLAHAIEDARR